MQAFQRFCVKSVSTACRSLKFTTANLRTFLGVIGYPRTSNPNCMSLIIIQIHTQEVSMSKAIDLTGRTFGLLKVIRRVEDVKPDRPMWLCECRCGKSVVKSSTSLTKQNGVKSCGCLRHQKSPELIDLTDMTFGDLRVLYQDCSAQSGKARWVCQCGCGNVVSVLSESLRRSKTTSCGCKCQVLKYDLTGREFGYLKVIDRASKGNRKSNEVYWRCLCRNCGRIVHISSYQLRHSNPYGHCNCTRFHVAAESATTRKDEHHD